MVSDFPSFSERLLLRRDRAQAQREPEERRSFPSLFGGAFIEALLATAKSSSPKISLPVWKGFH